MKAKILLTSFLFLAALAAPMTAHHSISAEFDAAKHVSITGVVSNVDWMNPHTYVFVDVQDPSIRKARTWACELASPNELARRGFTRESLKVGMSVRVAGARAKDGSFKIHIDALTVDGTPVVIR
jgi:hypothetical protein